MKNPRKIGNYFLNCMKFIKKRVDAREEKMRDYVRKVGLTEKEKNKDEQQ